MIRQDSQENTSTKVIEIPFCFGYTLLDEHRDDSIRDRCESDYQESTQEDTGCD